LAHPAKSFSLIVPPPRRSPLFPYTTLFRSVLYRGLALQHSLVFLHEPLPLVAHDRRFTESPLALAPSLAGKALALRGVSGLLAGLERRETRGTRFGTHASFSYLVCDASKQVLGIRSHTVSLVIPSSTTTRIPFTRTGSPVSLPASQPARRG